MNFSKAAFLVAFLVFLMALVVSFGAPAPLTLTWQQWAIIGLALVALGLAAPVTE